jgi:hypothetical protein
MADAQVDFNEFAEEIGRFQIAVGAPARRSRSACGFITTIFTTS